MAKYYTSLSNDTPDLIRVNVELTRTEMSKLRQLTDAKASDSFSEIVRKLIKQRASRSKVKVIKGQSVFLPKKPEIAQLKTIGTPIPRSIYIQKSSSWTSYQSNALNKKIKVQTNDIALKNRFQPNGRVPKKNNLIINQI